MIWIALVLLTIASFYDLRSREIPDWISVALLLVAMTAVVLGQHESGWLGMLIGSGLMFLLGLLLFALGGLGGGDVKLLVGLGAILGPIGLMCMLFWVAAAGGVLSIVALVRRQESFAYVPAIAFGLLVYGAWPGGTAAVLGL